MNTPTLGLFGDSYITRSGFPSLGLTWADHLSEKFETNATGKNGASLFYSINCWNKLTDRLGHDYFNYAIWTFTWHNRLFSDLKFRNDYFCNPFPDLTWDVSIYDDPMITDHYSFTHFRNAYKDYTKYIYDDKRSRFDYELELQWVMNLPTQHKNTKFIFIPNTHFSNTLCKKYFHTGVLMDFAFEDISNREPNAAGPMPIACGRPGHMNQNNHAKFTNVISGILNQYNQLANQVIPVDINQFEHVDSQ